MINTQENNLPSVDNNDETTSLKIHLTKLHTGVDFDNHQVRNYMFDYIADKTLLASSANVFAEFNVELSDHIGWLDLSDDALRKVITVSILSVFEDISEKEAAVIEACFQFVAKRERFNISRMKTEQLVSHKIFTRREFSSFSEQYKYDFLKHLNIKRHQDTKSINQCGLTQFHNVDSKNLTFFKLDKEGFKAHLIDFYFSQELSMFKKHLLKKDIASLCHQVDQYEKTLSVDTMALAYQLAYRKGVEEIAFESHCDYLNYIHNLESHIIKDIASPLSVGLVISSCW